MTTTRTCPSCDAQVAAGERFCASCGARMPDQPATPLPATPAATQPPQAPPAAPFAIPAEAAPPPPARRRPPIWLLIVLGLLGLGLASCVILVAAGLFLTPTGVSVATATPGSAVGGILPTVPGLNQPTPEPTPRPTRTPAPAPAPTSASSGGIVGGIAGGGSSSAGPAQTSVAQTAEAREAAAEATAEAEQLAASARQVFRDEFVDNRNNWFTGVFQEIETDVIEDGVFKVIWAANGSSYEVYEVRELANFIADVDCLVYAGDVDGSCGLIFGQNTELGFYKYEVFEDYYRLFAVPVAGESTLLAEGDPSGLYRPGEPNRLRVVRQGDRIRVYLNEQLLEDLRDASYPNGRVGVSTNSYREEGGVEIWFDNFTIWELP